MVRGAAGFGRDKDFKRLRWKENKYESKAIVEIVGQHGH